jgi:hypothetical protein
LAPPVYFHRKDARDPNQNLGIGQLRVEVDFVLTPTTQPERLQDNPNLATLPPEPPELEATGLESDARLSIQATKALTGVETPFERTVDGILQTG